MKTLVGYAHCEGLPLRGYAANAEKVRNFPWDIIRVITATSQHTQPRMRGGALGGCTLVMSYGGGSSGVRANSLAK